MSTSIFFQGGTLVLQGVDADERREVHIEAAKLRDTPEGAVLVPAVRG